MATGLDLTALVLSAFWFSSERNVLFAVWFVFFAGFLGLDIFNLLFSVGQIFAIRDEDKRSIEREYRSAAYTKKTR